MIFALEKNVTSIRIEPILYHTVVLNSIRRFTIGPLTARPEFVSQHLQVLAVQNTLEDISPLLANVTVFHRLTSFGQYLIDNTPTTTTLIQRAPNLRRLSLCPGQEADIDALISALSATRVTHLCIYSDRRVYDIVTSLPNLTYLGLDWDEELDRPDTGEVLLSPYQEIFEKPLAQWKVIMVFVDPGVGMDQVEALIERTEHDARYVWVARHGRTNLDSLTVSYYDEGGPSSGILVLDANDPTFGRPDIIYPLPEKEDMWDVAERIVPRRILAKQNENS